MFCQPASPTTSSRPWVATRSAPVPASPAYTAQVNVGSSVSYVVSATHVGSAVAQRVAVSVSLAPGFLYGTTTAIEGNSVRIRSVDPPGDSLLPLWSSGDITAATGNGPVLLRITFQARVLPGVAAGVYNLTAALTASKDIAPQ